MSTPPLPTGEWLARERRERARADFDDLSGSLVEFALADGACGPRASEHTRDLLMELRRLYREALDGEGGE